MHKTVLPSAISRGASGAQSHTPVPGTGDHVRRRRTGYTLDTYPLAAGEVGVNDVYQCTSSSATGRENRGAYGIQSQGPLSVSLPQHSLTSAFVSDYPSVRLERPSARPKDADCRVPGLGFDAQSVLSSAIPRGAAGAHSHTPVQGVGDTVRRGRTGYISDTFPLAPDGGSVDDLYQCYRSSTRARENRGAYRIQS